MYPYRSRLQWFVFGRYAHLAKAINTRRSHLQDTLLETRVQQLMRWNRLRFMVSLLLSLGVLATVAAWIARYLPAFEAATQLVDLVGAASGASTSVFTLAYLFLSRFLGQIEADILALLTVERRPRAET